MSDFAAENKKSWMGLTIMFSLHLLLPALKTDSTTDYSKMRVKQLKQILAERGVECVGCVEKSEFITKLQDTHHMEL